MKLKLVRKYKEANYTIGDLYINNVFFSNTLEDRDRGLTQNTPLSEIKRIKVPNETAIPTGTYKVTLNIVSPRFGMMSFYKSTCEGKLPRLLDVPGFDGILIHVGDGPKGSKLTSGCLLVGKNSVKGQLTDGKNVFVALYKELLKSKDHITITIE